MRIHRTLPFLYATFFALAAPQLALGADDGANTFDEVCTQCHTAKRNPLDNQHLSREQWNEAIERMKGYGAEVPKAKLPDLLDYLVRAKGPAGAATDPGKK